MADNIRTPQSGEEQQLARLAGEEVTPREPQSATEQWLELIYEQGGTGGGTGQDGITPIVDVTSIQGGHNVAFVYGEDDERNTDFDVMDGTDGQDGQDGQDGADGEPGQDGQDGQDGADGITPIVDVTNIQGGHNVAFVYGEDDQRNTDFDVIDGIIGQDGDTPEVYITNITGGHRITFSYGVSDPRNVQVDVMDGTDGQNGSNGNDGANGSDGITPTTTITSITGGHNIAFSYGSGDSRNTDVNVMDGQDGTNGQNGYTPVRGTDYWTAADISSMESYCNTYIDTQLGTVINGSY